jgi:hypothetical protein
MNSDANKHIRIARFIDIEACKEVFSESYSTFLIRSHKYYWHMENPEKQDKTEFQVQGEESHMETDFVLLSCWTILDGDKPTEKEWAIFEKAVVAIVSSPQKVYDFLNKTLNIERKDGRSHPFFRIDHKKVNYIDKREEKLNGNPTILDAIFTKDKRFENHKEYRFGVCYSAVYHEIITYIFSTHNPDDYIDKCYFNPNITKSDASKLLNIVSCATAGYGGFSGKRLCDIIANSGDLIDRASNRI